MSVATAVKVKKTRKQWAESEALFEELSANYEHLRKYAKVLLPPVRDIVGRESERDQVLAALHRPELSNVLLLAPAGSGKTALVQSTAEYDLKRLYLEIDLALMIADLSNTDEMAARLKSLFDEVEMISRKAGVDIVLFIDEAHQIVQLSAAAVEALKPLLAASGARGILVILATTFEEYHDHIAPNQPLVERLQRINLTPPDAKTTVHILRGMARHYGVEDQFYNDALFEEIVELTDRYMPQSMQPRKSIRMLDAMVGHHRYSGVAMDMRLLADVLYDSTGINIAFRADGARIKENLDSAVFSQDLATSVVARRLQICVADLQDKSKPQASFLFAGSTGTGKTELTKQLSRLMFGDDQGRMIRFDMSEYAEDSSMGQFQSQLTREVANYGNGIVLLDEIEKASRAILRLLYQVLDDGRLSDDNGRQVSFLNCYIVMTTNSGSNIFDVIGKYESSDTGSGENLKDYMKNIERAIRDDDFPEALLGRIDEIVPFQPLSTETMRKIVKRKLEYLCMDVWRKHDVQLRITPDVLVYLVDDVAAKDSKSGGAREALRTMAKEVTSRVAKFLNENPGERKIQLYIEGDMRKENKHMRRTKAYPEVCAAV